MPRRSPLSEHLPAGCSDHLGIKIGSGLEVDHEGQRAAAIKWIASFDDAPLVSRLRSWFAIFGVRTIFVGGLGSHYIHPEVCIYILFYGYACTYIILIMYVKIMHMCIYIYICVCVCVYFCF